MREHLPDKRPPQKFHHLRQDVYKRQIMIIGAYSLLWGIVPFSLEIDQTFIGAILTAIGDVYKRQLYVLGGICGGLFYMIAYNIFPYFSQTLPLSLIHIYHYPGRSTGTV